jgi:hypothetical protein
MTAATRARHSAAGYGAFTTVQLPKPMLAVSADASENDIGSLLSRISNCQATASSMPWRMS